MNEDGFDNTVYLKCSGFTIPLYSCRHTANHGTIDSTGGVVIKYVKVVEVTASSGYAGCRTGTYLNKY